jgi:hypothetical protein
VLSLCRGTVTAVVERAPGLVRVELDGRPCVCYPALTGPVALGDEVLVNVQAVELGLGSGGFDVLYANLTRGIGRPADPGAHVMKLPYTPLQHAVRHLEEDAVGTQGLGGMPVVCCSLHSQVAPVCAAIGGDARIGYVQLEGGALPVALSDTIRLLAARGYLDATFAPGSAVGGGEACVSVPSALCLCAEREIAIAVCSPGPGIVGTGSALGHGGVSAAAAANAAVALGGRPVVAARVSDADPRERHRGVSHHTRSVVRLALARVAIAWPEGIDPPDGLEVELVDTAGWEAACAGLPLSHMGRAPGEDPSFFAAAFAAGRLARRMLDEA